MTWCGREDGAEDQPIAASALHSGQWRPPTQWKSLSPQQRGVMERSAQLSAVWLDSPVPFLAHLAVHFLPSPHDAARQSSRV